MTEDDRVPGAEKGAVKNPRQEAQEAQRCGVSELSTVAQSNMR